MNDRRSGTPDPAHPKPGGNILSRAYLRFLKIRGGSREIALGLALGVFVGMTPFMGFQTPVAVFLAAMFKWSKLSAALGVWISNPLTAPFIYPVTYFVGAKLLGMSQIPPMPAKMGLSEFVEILKHSPLIVLDLLAGGIVLGLPLAFVAYGFSYSAIQSYRKRLKPKLKRERRGSKPKKKRRRVNGKKVARR